MNLVGKDDEQGIFPKRVLPAIDEIGPLAAFDELKFNGVVMMTHGEPAWPTYPAQPAHPSGKFIQAKHTGGEGGVS